MPAAKPSDAPKRPRGRPRVEIDPDAVADVVAELFAEGGLEAVSMPDAAERLSVSRATLYRTVRTKEDLLGVLFERSTKELMQSAQRTVKSVEDPADCLLALVRLQIETAVRMRQYMPVFFGGGGLPGEVFARWHGWSRKYEALWVRVVKDNMTNGVIAEADPVITARLLLGSCLWVSRWYRPTEKYDTKTIADTAETLVRAIQGRSSAVEGSPKRAAR